MKKAFVLLLALAVLGGAVFAQVQPTISGWGQVQWTYDLNEPNYHGFTNSYSLTADLPLVASASKTSTGEDVYGTATVKDIRFVLRLTAIEGTPTIRGTVTDLSAAIVTGPLTTTIYSKPSLSLNNATHFTPFKDDDADFNASTTPIATVRFNPAVFGGIATAYKIGDLGTFTARLASLQYGAGTTVDPYRYEDKYAANATLSLKPIDLIGLTLGGGYNFDNKDLGATVKVDLAPVEGITSFFAADFYKQDAVDMMLDGRFNLAATFGKTTVSTDAFYMNKAGAASTDDLLSVKFMVADSGTVEGLSASLGVFAMDLLAGNDPMLLGVANTLSYKINLTDKNFITPYQKATYEFNDELLYLNFGTTINIIPNTTFTIDYTAGSMGNKQFPGGTFAATGLNGLGTGTDKGKIYFRARVSL